MFLQRALQTVALLLKVPLNDLQSKRVNVIKYLCGIAGIRFNTFLKLRFEYLVAIW